MVNVILFILAVAFTICRLTLKKEWYSPKSEETFLSYLLFFNVGLMGVLGAYAHVFLADEIARSIGWAPGSPFQFEMAMANLAFGVLGILSYWIRGRFWDATIIGWSVLFVGCFVGHVMEYYTKNNTAPYNIGPYIWFYDLILPILVIALLYRIRFAKR
ncbi:MAG: DUF6790 family protein [Parachlamydiales bacterium]